MSANDASGKGEVAARWVAFLASADGRAAARAIAANPGLEPAFVAAFAAGAVLGAQLTCSHFVASATLLKASARQ